MNGKISVVFALGNKPLSMFSLFLMSCVQKLPVPHTLLLQTVVLSSACFFQMIKYYFVILYEILTEA